MATVLNWAGYKEMLNGPFRGTLLLPIDDVSAKLLTQQQQQQQRRQLAEAAAAATPTC
jgi:hypothetical protein